MEQLNDSKPLDGIKILEYGVFHAGPGGVAILGDLGAEIIKIETDAGDPERYWTRVADLDFALENGESLMFEISNRNKKGICLDIKTAKGRDIFERLVGEADVFLTNLRNSTKVKLGLDYTTLAAINADIVYASVSGYGTKGTMSDLGGFDPLGQAISGMLYVTGSTEPEMIHLGVLDQAAAITVSHAIITALFVRERRGIGQEVHVSLYSSALWLQYANLMMNNVLGVDPCIPGHRSKHSPLRNFFRCQDDKWIHGTHHPDEKYWATFCKATGQQALLKDPRYTDENGKPKNIEELVKVFDRVFATRPRDAWVPLLQKKGLMFAPVQHIREVQMDPQALANDFVVPFQHPMLGQINIPGYPVQFSACRAGTSSAAPRLGEHTDEVLQYLGYAMHDIEQLRKEDVVK